MLTTTFSIFWLTANLDDVLATATSSAEWNDVLSVAQAHIGYTNISTTPNITSNVHTRTHTIISSILRYPRSPGKKGNSFGELAGPHMKPNSSEVDVHVMAPGVKTRGGGEDSLELYKSSDNQYSLGIVLPVFPRISNDSVQMPSLVPRGATEYVEISATTSGTMTTMITTAIMERSIEIPAYSRFTALICCLIILSFGVLGNLMVSAAGLNYPFHPASINGCHLY